MKKKLSVDQARLESLLRIAQYQAKSEQDLLDFTLNEIIALTKSAMGYIYFYDDNLREFTLNTWSKGVMDVCAIREPKTKYNLDQTGIWGEAVRQACPIVLNDFTVSHPLKKGYPEGHAPISRFLTLPIFSNQHIVAVIGLANKKRNYTDSDVRQVQDAVGKAIGLLGTYENITQRKLQEQRNAHLAAIVASSEDAIIATDQKGIITNWNKGAQKIYGYTESEIVGKAISVLTPPDRQDEPARILERLRQGETLQHYEARRLRKSGELFYISLSVSPVVNLGGKVTGYSIIGRDITERKKQQRELEGYRDFLENIEDSCFEFGLNGRCTFCNETAYRMLGYTREEFLNLSHHQRFATKSQADGVYKIYNEVYNTGMPAKLFESDMLCKDRSVINMEMVVSSIKDDQGNVVGFRAVGRDITARKEALAEQERYRDFMENINEGCFETDLAGNITYVNAIAARWIGRTPDQVIGSNNRQFTTPKQAGKLYKAFNEIYRTGNPAEIIDYEYFDEQGNIKYQELSVSLIHDAQGNAVGFRGTSREVTERKRVQEALLQSETRYRNLFQYSKAVMLIIDPDTAEIIDANLAACYYYRYTKDELLRKKMTEINALTEDELQDEMAKAKLEQRSHFYFKHRLANGEIHPVEVFSGPIEIGGKYLLYSIIHDITGRRKSEEALRRSEEKHRTILETMAEGYTENDLDGNVKFVNDAACRLLGYERGDLIGMNYRKIHSPDTAKYMYENFHRLYETGEPEFLLDYEAISKDGSLLTFQSNAALIRDSSGKPMGFSIMTRDITERKKAEEALRKSEEKYRSILETMEEAYIEIDLNGNYTFVNDAVCRLLGYTRDEMIGLSYRKIHKPDIVQRLKPVYKRVYETGKPEFLIDTEVVRMDGTLIILQTNVALMQDALGKPIGFRVLGRDITDHRNAEEALRRSEEKYRTILESITEGYFETDLKGTITFVNDAGCDMLGYQREELLNHAGRLLTSPKAKKAIVSVIKNVYETGVPSSLFDYETVRKDGSACVHQVNIGLIRGITGNQIGFRIVARDITERKRAVEELARSEERIRALFNNIPVPTFVWKAQKDKLILVEFNDAALQFTGGKIIGYIGRTVEECYAHSPQIPVDMQQCFSLRTNIEKSFWFSFDDTSEKKYVIIKYAFAPPDNVIMHVNDVTAQKRAEENLHYISIHDSLTGLYNRFYADAEIDRIVTSRLRPVSVISIDLNNLKTVNDRYGHATGDFYIRNAASLLKQTFRPEDLVARIGGDEFIVILSSVDEQVCDQAVRRLKENLEILNKVADQQLSLAVGVATAHTGDDFLECIKKADKRMYEEKVSWKATSAKCKQ